MLPRGTLSRSALVLVKLGNEIAAHAEDPLAFIRDRDLFGELADDERFTAAYTAALDALHAQGARATLESRASLDRPATA